jgi:hypothetical protein
MYDRGMPTADERRIPLDEAFRRWTGHEPPAPLTSAERAELDAKIAKAEEDARRIYGDPAAA